MDDTLFNVTDEIRQKALKESIKVMIDNGLPINFDKAFNLAISLGETFSSKELFYKIVEESGLHDNKLAEMGKTKYVFNSTRTYNHVFN